MSPVSEERLDQMEAALRQKIETLTGFADNIAMERKLESMFKFFDSNSSGTIDFEEFFAAMTRSNFVGVQRELEALFERYDEDCFGYICYHDLCTHLFGMGKAIGDSVSRSVVERVKSRILDLGGANGIRTVTHLLKSMDKDGSNTLDRVDLAEGLSSFGMQDINDTPGGDLDRLMSYFDREGKGKICIEEFHRGLRGTMSKPRKLLTKQAFTKLDRSGKGVVSVDDLRASFSAAQHPDVVSGRCSEDEILTDMLSDYEGPGSDGNVYWQEFLDYYKDLSSAVQSDDYFALMMRNAWHLAGGEGWAEE